jgi:hypothetical protein
MGFDNPPVKYPFMEPFVKLNAPSVSGVYILFSTPGLTWEVIYVGDADDVKGRLLDYLRGDIPCITERGPTAFICEQVDAEKRAARRDQLIGEYTPT